MSLPLLFAIALSTAAVTPANAGTHVRVTYASDARVPRGPNDPVLPRGSQPCGSFPTSGTGILRLSEGVKPPQRVQFARADYSSLPAAEKHVQGMLFAEVVIGETGRVSTIHILRSVAPAFHALRI